MVWVITSEAEAEAIKDLNTISDRAAAIVGAAILDNRLETSLKRRMLDEPDVQKEMFKNSGPLGPFSSRIKLAYLLGLYSEKVYRDLNCIKDIRNEFAHNLAVRDFKNQSVADKCKNLKIIERHVIPREDMTNPKYAGIGTFMVEPEYAENMVNPRYRYLLSVRFFVSILTPIGIFPPIKFNPPV